MAAGELPGSVASLQGAKLGELLQDPIQPDATSTQGAGQTLKQLCDWGPSSVGFGPGTKWPQQLARRIFIESVDAQYDTTNQYGGGGAVVDRGRNMGVVEILNLGQVHLTTGVPSAPITPRHIATRKCEAPLYLNLAPAVQLVVHIPIHLVFDTQDTLRLLWQPSGFWGLFKTAWLFYRGVGTQQ